MKSVGLEVEGGFYFVDVVEFFPSEEFYLHFNRGVVLRAIYHFAWGAAKVSVSCCRKVDWLAELQAFFDAVGGHIEDFADDV